DHGDALATSAHRLDDVGEDGIDQRAQTQHDGDADEEVEARDRAEKEQDPVDRRACGEQEDRDAEGAETGGVDEGEYRECSNECELHRSFLCQHSRINTSVLSYRLAQAGFVMPRHVDHTRRREEIASALWRVVQRDGMRAVSVRSVAKEGG